MLTKKELLKYSKRQNQLYPTFIKPENENLKEFGSVLCEIGDNALGKTRKELESEFDDVLCAFDVDTILAQGLQKLCFDLLTFESQLAEQTVEFRQEVFKESFACLAKPSNSYSVEVISALNNKLKPAEPFTKEKIESLLYSDLPEFHKVTELKSISSAQLLQKYNVSLVQGLLFHCRQIKITLPNVSLFRAQFRQLLKHIKFFQLVASFSKKEDCVEIEIDGPMSLFVNTNKYGFNLACFFPALLFMPQWELEAMIELGKLPRQSGELKLSHKSNLVSHYKNYSAYIPEEFKLFSNGFEKLEHCAWKLNENCDEILFDGDHSFFPDFEFIHDNGTRVYLELFHPWHSAALKHRLFSLAKKQPSFILLLGVARALLKDTTFAEEVQQYSYFKQFSFLFRDVVLPEKVQALLKAFE